MIEKLPSEKFVLAITTEQVEVSKDLLALHANNKGSYGVERIVDLSNIISRFGIPNLAYDCEVYGDYEETDHDRAEVVYPWYAGLYDFNNLVDLFLGAYVWEGGRDPLFPPPSSTQTDPDSKQHAIQFEHNRDRERQAIYVQIQQLGIKGWFAREVSAMVQGYINLLDGYSSENKSEKIAGYIQTISELLSFID